MLGLWKQIKLNYYSLCNFIIFNLKNVYLKIFYKSKLQIIKE